MTRREIRKFLGIISVGWLVGVSWIQFAYLPDSEIQSMESPEVQDRLALECNGPYTDRYACKEQIILETSQDTFANLSLRLAVVVVVPGLLWGLARTRFRDPHKTKVFALPPDHPAHGKTEGEGASDAPKADWKKAARDRLAQSRPPMFPPKDET